MSSMLVHEGLERTNKRVKRLIKSVAMESLDDDIKFSLITKLAGVKDIVDAKLLTLKEEETNG